MEKMSEKNQPITCSQKLKNRVALSIAEFEGSTIVTGESMLGYSVMDGLLRVF